ncbi:MAG: protein TolR [Pseudomonadota bacterium]
MGASVQSGGKAGARRRGRGGQPISEINVTPFVDVMLVLLIIFMVAAPLLTVGVPLELPKTQARSLPQEQEEPLAVNMDADGTIYIQKTPVEAATLVERLTAIRAERETDKVYLRADQALDYGRVMQVMGALQAGGFFNVALVTEQPSPQEE